MAKLYETFGTTNKLAKGGVAFDLNGLYSFEHEGQTFVSEFHLTYMSDMNVEYQRELAKLQKPYLKAIRKDKLDPAVSIEIAVRAFCKCILVGWQNVMCFTEEEFNAVVASGKKPEVPYSFENACELMKAMPELFQLLSENAADPQNFQASSVEDLTKMGNDLPEDLSGNLTTQPNQLVRGNGELTQN